MELVGVPPVGAAGIAYSFAFSAIGGSGTYTYTNSTLPAGWSLTTGVLANASPSAGSFKVTITLSDNARSPPVEQTFTVTIT